MMIYSPPREYLTSQEREREIKLALYREKCMHVCMYVRGITAIKAQPGHKRDTLSGETFITSRGPDN